MTVVKKYYKAACKVLESQWRKMLRAGLISVSPMPLPEVGRARRVRVEILIQGSDRVPLVAKLTDGWLCDRDSSQICCVNTVGSYFGI